MDMLPAANYPLPSQASLQLQYVGKDLRDCLTPAAVIDRAIVKRNCNAMLDACKALAVSFRAHVKSHKTLELSKLQVGEDGPADFVVSTLAEAENLLPFLRECQEKKRSCSLIYGVPVPLSSIHRLWTLATKLPPCAINVLVDNRDAFRRFQQELEKILARHAKDRTLNTSVKIGVYIKIDTGYHRAGIQTSSVDFQPLVDLVTASTESLAFKGFYSHYGHSYAGSSEDDAAEGLLAELKELHDATKAVPENQRQKLVLTVGATPTATAAQNMLRGTGPKVTEFKELLRKLKEAFTVELHAGVYPLLDLQQVATHARPPTAQSQEGFEPLSKSNIGLRMLVEVTSIYSERKKPEALVSAGSLALGREPCKSYPGWGIVAQNLSRSQHSIIYDEQGEKAGWIVGRVSQEHGILTGEGPPETLDALTVGDKLLLWPNHACVAGAGFGWYLIVDSDAHKEADKIVDVWVRWRGW
ncbi:putative serine dehydratase domain-containing protein [Lophiotrema nucula]|uniref:D-serine dehydratase n=1 Tax=Lophiotrema nucula TaxID=690887 RepID=A0A6A5ZT03_9PLEO|nr:putative serine dehydratase domain-containing protein [Lophiotrema nucula]